MIFAIYALMVFLVVFFSIKCATYLDMIEAKTNLSGIFLSGVILAGITSLPELVTSVSAISWLGSPELVFGNILGSNIFNFTILAAMILIFFKLFLTHPINRDHDKSLYMLIVIYSLLFLKLQLDFDITVFGIDIISILIVVFYIISLKFMTISDQEEDSDEAVEDYDVKHILIKFILFSMGLVISSVLITFITDEITKVTGIGETMAGALLLGIVTSIPELVTSVTLCKLGNFNGVFGNMIGSNIFNYVIITLSDILYRQGSIYVINNESYKLTLFGLIATILVIYILKSKIQDQGQREISKGSKLSYILSSFLIVSSYILFIFL